MRKWLMFLLSLSLMFFVLAACGGEEEPVEEEEEEVVEEEPVEGEEEVVEEEPVEGEEAAGDAEVITFAAQSDSTPATQLAIEEFNSIQDEYVVEWTEMTNDSAQLHDQLLTSLSSEAGEYDVLSLDVVWAGEFAAAGYLEPLDIYMTEDGIVAEDYNAGSMASGNYLGKQFTMPYFPDVGLLYFRDDIVSEEDAQTLISGDYTYEDLAAMAEKYVEESEAEVGFAFQAKQYEGLTVNANEFTSEFGDVEAGLETMLEFVEAGWTPDDILNYDEAATHTAFETGDAVFARNWPYAYGRLINAEESGATVAPEDVSVAPLPNGGTVGGWLLGINSSSEVKEGAWEFIKWLAGPDGQRILATEGGYLPGYNPLLEDEEVLAANELLATEGFQNALQSSIPRPVSANYSEVSNAIQLAVHSYLSSGEGLDEAVTTIEEALAAEE